MNKHLILSLDDSKFVISYYGGGRYKSKVVPACYLNQNSFKESFKNKFDRRFSKIIINFMAENMIFLNELSKVTVCCKKTKITKQLKPNLPFLKMEHFDNLEDFKKAKDILNVWLNCTKVPIRKRINNISYLRERRIKNV